jgi:hypothetical protein
MNEWEAYGCVPAREELSTMATTRKQLNEIILHKYQSYPCSNSQQYQKIERDDDDDELFISYHMKPHTMDAENGFHKQKMDQKLN